MIIKLFHQRTISMNSIIMLINNYEYSLKLIIILVGAHFTL